MATTSYQTPEQQSLNRPAEATNRQSLALDYASDTANRLIDAALERGLSPGKARQMTAGNRDLAFDTAKELRTMVAEYIKEAGYIPPELAKYASVTQNANGEQIVVLTAAASTNMKAFAKAIQIADFSPAFEETGQESLVNLMAAAKAMEVLCTDYGVTSLAKFQTARGSSLMNRSLGNPNAGGSRSPYDTDPSRASGRGNNTDRNEWRRRANTEQYDFSNPVDTRLSLFARGYDALNSEQRTAVRQRVNQGGNYINPDDTYSTIVSNWKGGKIPGDRAADMMGAVSEQFGSRWPARNERASLEDIRGIIGDIDRHDPKTSNAPARNLNAFRDHLEAYARHSGFSREQLYPSREERKDEPKAA